MKKEKITINKNKLLLNSRKFTTSEIGRGTGVFRAKKGKGSYTRKEKYRKSLNY
jgi:stalled ribosome alternative rescue factor ArfA